MANNATPLTYIGNLTDNPELRFTPTGAAVCKFRLAATPRYLDKASGEWKDGSPGFLDVTCWRQLAENVAESLAKGARVMAAGNLVQDHWTVPDGQPNAGEKRSRWVLQAHSVGPELSWATASVHKMTRSRDGVPPDDPWATASKERPATAEDSRASFDDEPPF
jgi:single-strand DNA-binding protein